MSATAYADDDDPPDIWIRNSVTGETFRLNQSREQWLDLQAFAAVCGLTIEQVINQALERFFREPNR